MMKPRVLACTVVLALSATVACNRTETNRDAQRAADQVKVAAAQAGDKLADSWLTTKIQAQFFVDNDIKSRYINVRSHDGLVALKGFVESDDVRRQVLEITRNTDGVKQVDDHELLVGRPVTQSFEVASTPPAAAVATTGVTTASSATPPPDDSMMTSLVQAKYFQDPAIKSRHIEVQAANGVVTLRGEVASDNERAQALLLARNTQGVGRVEDNLTVDASLGQASQLSASPIGQANSTVASPPAPPKGEATAADAAGAQHVDTSIETALKQKFAADARVKAATITISTQDGVVTLQGTAPTAAAKQRALALAKETDGVTQVVDRIAVRPKG